MQRELTITIDEQVYQALDSIVGQQHISQFIEDLLRSHMRMAERDIDRRPVSGDDTADDALRTVREQHPTAISGVARLREQHLRVDMEAGYRAMAADEAYEAAALEWIQGTVGDVFDETQ